MLFFLSKSLENALYVNNRDSHTDNWYITETGIVVALDCENTRLVPQTHDLALLLNFSTHFTERQKDAYLEKYIKEFNTINKEKITDPTIFKLEYYNSMLHKAFTLFCSWQQRPSRKEQTQHVLHNGRIALTRLKEEMPSYYTRHRHAYEHLDFSLGRLMMQHP